MYLCFLQIFYAAVEMHGHSTSTNIIVKAPEMPY